MSKLELFCNSVLSELSQVDKASKEYQDKFIYMSEIAPALFPEEYSYFLKKVGLETFFSNWKNSVQSLLNLAQSYEVDTVNKKVSVIYGDNKIEGELVDVREFIYKELNLTKNSWESELTLSILAQLDNFEVFQVANAIILKNLQD